MEVATGINYIKKLVVVGTNFLISIERVLISVSSKVVEEETVVEALADMMEGTF